MQLAELIEIINTFSLSTFSIISLLIVLRIGYRTWLYRKAETKIPILLKRDLYMFISMSLYISTLLILRVSGFTNLSSHLEWIIFSNITLLGPFAFWAWVEWSQ